MIESLKIFIGIAFLWFGIPIGNFLAKHTKEELKDGKIWFKLIILIALIGSIIALIIRNDVLMFGFLFIAIITIRSLKNDDKKRK